MFFLNSPRPESAGAYGRPRAEGLGIGVWSSGCAVWSRRLGAWGVGPVVRSLCLRVRFHLQLFTRNLRLVSGVMERFQILFRILRSCWGGESGHHFKAVWRPWFWRGKSSYCIVYVALCKLAVCGLSLVIVAFTQVRACHGGEV